MLQNIQLILIFKQKIMKGLMEFKKLSVLVILAVFSLCSVSCSSDDNGPTNPTDAIKGNYAGKMVTSPEVPAPVDGNMDDATQGVDVTAKIDNENINFENFPIRDIVVSIVGEDKADEIIEMVGKVSYKIAYKATINEAKDNISFTLTPEPLHLELTIPESGEKENKTLIIDVEVIAAENGNYDIKTTDIKFNITATKVLLGETELPGFTPTSFGFCMSKAK